MLLISYRCRSINYRRPAKLRYFIQSICHEVICSRIWSATEPLSLFHLQLCCATFTNLVSIKKLCLRLWCHSRVGFGLMLRLLGLLRFFWLYQVGPQHFTCIVHWTKIVCLILARYLKSRWNFYYLFCSRLWCLTTTWWA